MAIDDQAARALLRSLFDAAVAAADPARIVPCRLPDAPPGRTVVVGAGKASAAMARAFEQSWHGPLSGIVVTRYGHAVACDRIEIVEAGHPVPDAAGEQAARRILDLVSGLGPDDLTVSLISGGGSALLALPAAGLTLADKQQISRRLLLSGASISEMNCVRKHLSAIKGGRLAAAAHPARMVSLLISDVPGDDPTVIASGPTVPDPTTRAEARAILARYAIEISPAVAAHLASEESETLKAGDTRLSRASAEVIAAPKASLAAAAELARRNGVTPVVLGDAIEGEARQVAADMAAATLRIPADLAGSGSPVVLLSGGETTVTVKGQGRGGRNVEFLLALAIALRGEPSVWALAADTDGIDGVGDAAGAMISPDTLSRARTLGIDPDASLDDNDGHSAFARLGDAVVTGPTLTNVNDFRAILVVPR